MNDGPTHRPAPPMTLARGGIGIAALAAAGIAGYLCFLSLSNRGLPAGCGAGSGCEQVLTSRWSQVFGVPVSGSAAVVYLAVTAAAILGGTKSSFPVREAAWSMLLLLGGVVLGAAVWFLGLQFFVLKTVCPWCLADHALGLLIGGLIVGCAVFAGRKSSSPTAHAPEESLEVKAPGEPHDEVANEAERETVHRPETGIFARRRVGALTAAGVLMVAGLALAQIFGGYRAPAVARLPAGENADTGPGPDRLIAVLDGTFQLAPHELPALGSPDAPKLLVVLFDYCCPHCRATHEYLLGGMPRYGNQLGVILLPTPLNRECNPYWEHDEARFQHACELARLALAVFRADRNAFARYDEWLFEPETPRDPVEARRRAEELVTAAVLETALADPWIAERIAADVKAGHDSKAERIPVILSPDIDTIVGRPEDQESLFELLEVELQIRPEQNQ